MSTAQHILVVDDDPMLRDLLVKTLEAIGHMAVAAENGLQALSLLQQQTFSIVISDIKMPEMDGVELLRRIRSAHPGLPVLFISGFATAELLGRAEPDGFLTKPFRIHHVEEMIEKVTSRRLSTDS